LEGFDQDWRYVDASDRSATYTKLPPGSYTFRVKASNNDGVWNEQGASIAITIIPPWWMTWWFRSAAIAALLASAYTGYAWRVRHLEHRQQALQQAHDRLETEVQHRTAELAQRTQSLEAEIEERKRMELKLERTHKRLLDLSRQAGMAEVATNVLHNVGNVLNSVNVSAALLAGNAKKSKVSSLGKVAAMLDEHAGDLGAFITTDPKGRQVPGYLSQLAAQLAREQELSLNELALLRQNIEHINEIVAMQQNYAKISGVTETVRLADLVEDALGMNSGALARHGIELIREFSDVPPVTIEKHKVLQILVNLIRNAKYACDDSGRDDKRITLRVASGDDTVKISVEDNGVGIAPENLTRIFGHGFTTRKEGHGFGLHSGALAAKDLGGTLKAFSEGPGQGAIFTLELPLKSAKVSP
jgi:C4-dicarboxylate-specific signal transduction histidine kinase